jgi:hypothetical protein
LYQEIAKIIQDELNGRAVAISKGNGKVRAAITSHGNSNYLIGVRELADIIQLRPNNFETFDEKVKPSWYYLLLLFYCATGNRI